MPERRRRSILGPVLLILLGLGLLAQQLGFVEWNWEALLRLWPLLLILAGLDLLLGRSTVGGLILLIAGLGLFIVIVVLVGWFGPPGSQAELRDLSLPAQGVERATIQIDASIGPLRIEPLNTADSLMEAHLALDERRAELLFEHEVVGGEAKVRLGSRQSRWAPWSGQWEEGWQIALARDIPWNLQINGGVNSMDVDLAGLSIEHLSVDLGVGNAHLILAGGDYSAEINGGVGSMIIEIPADVPARILVDGGLGTVNIDPRFARQGAYYVTEGLQPEQGAVQINVDGGIGSIAVR